MIHSGKQERYWAYITEVSHALPTMNEIPEYYRDISVSFRSWFKVKTFEKAPHDVMSQCIVVSSKRTLSEASRLSMSPYFIIDYQVVSG